MCEKEGDDTRPMNRATPPQDSTVAVSAQTEIGTDALTRQSYTYPLLLGTFIYISIIRLLIFISLMRD
ncbi:hypothetical protein LMG29542_07781 [Paraburkholderia humisilvae]|uniref:Uncharacterized protein n=1 Tax=Paraburkholderia humisilvae TaxID=627669 RepID=A0A6J5F6A5_9BURK|nr:hypothetical protein LMG29542_07781 [Paraburkholderia humisilvae]